MVFISLRVYRKHNYTRCVCACCVREAINDIIDYLGSGHRRNNQLFGACLFISNIFNDLPMIHDDDNSVD